MAINTTINLGLKKPTTDETVGACHGAYNDNSDTLDAWAATVAKKPTRESFTVSSWSALSGKSPFTYSATVTASTTIGADTQVELINDDAVKFGTYGFAIGAVSGQTITIYSVGEPATSVTLKVDIGG